MGVIAINQTGYALPGNNTLIAQPLAVSGQTATVAQTSTPVTVTGGNNVPATTPVTGGNNIPPSIPVTGGNNIPATVAPVATVTNVTAPTGFIDNLKVAVDPSVKVNAPGTTTPTGKWYDDKKKLYLVMGISLLMLCVIIYFLFKK